VASVLCSAAASAGAQQPTLEYDVKAAFVLNFVRYVDWPSPQTVPPLRLCVMQPSPFAGRLDAVVIGEQWGGAPIEVRTIPAVRRAPECHLIYVPAAAADRFTIEAGALAVSPVLTVGEDDRFLQRGGMIRLFVEDNRVRFAVNQRAAEAVRLSISSRLLRLARQVIETGIP
jgi:hypothetical protein